MDERKSLMVETVGGITTTDLYWDCECEKAFIHPKELSVCPYCEAAPANQPDSRVNEILESGFSGAGIGAYAPLCTVKHLALIWIRDHLTLDAAWPDGMWCEYSFGERCYALNVYLDKDGNRRATAFPAFGNREVDLKSPIEVL